MTDIYVGQLVSSNYLEHHGILGMKWGVRKYQNEDGTLTDAGKKRYKTKTNFEKQTARDRRIRRNAIKSAKTTIAAVSLGLYLYKNYKDSTVPSIRPVKVGKRSVSSLMNTMHRSSAGPKKFSDMTMDDLKKMDLW